MAARASFSNDSRIVKMPLPKSLLLKDYLLDDLSSCSSNGFQSYPRRQCSTTVRYLIEIDLNKHIKLPPSQKRQPKQFLKSKSKSKYPSMLRRASAAVVNAFKHFSFSGTGKPKKANFLPRSLSRRLSKHGFWKRTTDHHNKDFKRLKSFDESIKQKKNIQPPSSKVSTAVTSTTTAVGPNTSSSNSNTSSNSEFIATSDTPTTGNSSKINVAQNDVEESEQQSPEKKNMANGKKVGVTTATATNHSAANGNAKKGWQNEEKEQFSPISVMDFPCDNGDDDKDEVTSPFKHGHLRIEGSKRKLMTKVRRFESLAQLKPIKLGDRIALSESRTHDWVFGSHMQTQLELAQEENQIEKKAIALLQLMKATMSSHNLFESIAVESNLLGFFVEQLTEGNVSDYAMLQVAKDWINGQTKEMLLDWKFQKNRLTYIKDMEKGVKWLKYDDEVGKAKVGLELAHEVFTSLVDEIILDFYL